MQRRALEELEGRGRRERESPVRGPDEAARRGERRADDLVDAEVLECEGDAADVGDGVDRADLVEVDLVRRDAVDVALGLGEAAERLVRACMGARGEVGGVDELADGGPVAMDVLVGGDDLDPGGADAVALRARVDDVDAEASQPVADGRLRGARVEERAEEHVAGDARDGVDVEEPAHAAAARAMRLATVAAPNPSSMLTTATPGAQEESIDMSATCPPAATPYPTLVGTAMTGVATSPPTTDASAASCPAATTTQSAARRSGSATARRCSPATPDVLLDGGVRPEQLAGALHLADDGAVRRAGGDDRHGPEGLRHPASQPHHAGLGVLLEAVDRGSRGGPGGLVGAGDDDRLGPALDEPGDDRGDLIGPLPLGEHGLRHALPKPALGVEPREAQVEDGEVVGHWGESRSGAAGANPERG